MLAAGVLDLPDSFTLGVILAVILLIVLAFRADRKAKSSGTPPIPRRIIVVLLLATVVCIGYASVTYVPKNKVATLSNMNGRDGILEQGLQFKPPWDNIKQYDDVVVTEGSHVAWSIATSREVDRSYLMAHSCVRTFRELNRAGQSNANEFACSFNGKSILVLGE